MQVGHAVNTASIGHGDGAVLAKKADKGFIDPFTLAFHIDGMDEEFCAVTC
jgi:hypothetical protein